MEDPIKFSLASGVASLGNDLAALKSIFGIASTKKSDINLDKIFKFSKMEEHLLNIKDSTLTVHQISSMRCLDKQE